MPGPNLESRSSASVGCAFNHKVEKLLQEDGAGSDRYDTNYSGSKRPLT